MKCLYWFNTARIILLICMIIATYTECSLWWIVAIPWAISCIVGIFITLPFIALIGIMAGAAQADWMSDEFVIFVFFIIPTALSFVGEKFLGRMFSKKKPKYKATQNTEQKEQNHSRVGYGYRSY